MSHIEEITDILRGFKSTKFRPNELPFEQAAKSMSSDNPLVTAKPWNNGRWAMFNNATKKGAVFTYTGVIKWTSDIHTGNFVPEGYEAPIGLPESRIQTEPSHKCEFSYAFDTTIDTSLWDNIKVFEKHAVAQPGFNKAGRKRRQWQTGVLPSERDKYVISAKVFTRQTPMNTKQGGGYSVPYKLHPWIQIAVQDIDKTHHIPNPEKPRYLVYDCDTSVLSALDDSETPEFQQNDIVYMSFMLLFTVTRDAWTPEIVPIEFVRVGKLPDITTPQSDIASLTGMTSFQPLEIGSTMMLISSTDTNPIQSYDFKPTDTAFDDMEQAFAEMESAPVSTPKKNLKRKGRDFEEKSFTATKRQAMDVDMESPIIIDADDSGVTVFASRNRSRGKGKEKATSRV